MFHYRQVLVRMRQGDSDREIARSRTMGRRKIAQVRERAAERGWLAPDVPLPDDATLAAAFERPQTLPAGCVSCGAARYLAQISAIFGTGGGCALGNKIAIGDMLPIPDHQFAAH